jgi:hypothetical protein
MKYALARNTHSAGRHYHCFGNLIMSTSFIKGTPLLSDAFIYDTQEEAQEELDKDWRLKLNEYFVVFIEEKELFEAKLKDV